MLVSQAEYARRKGIKPSSVSSLIRHGRITLVDGKIDTEQADRELAMTDGPARKKAKPKLVSLNPPDKPPVTYAQANTMREAYRAQLAKLDFEERVGKLISAEQVKREAFEAGRQIREAFMVLPERVSAVLVGQDEAAIRERLKSEIVLILKTLAGSLG